VSRPRTLVVVVGTGTEVGKTWVAARLLERWREAGLSVAARKPAQSFDPDHAGPTDADVLAQASAEDPDTVCPPHRRYPLPVAPPMAARRLGRPRLALADLVGEVEWPSPAVDVGLVETAGGLRSPQADDGDALQMARSLGPEVVVLVADAGLGTINAVRLAADALAGARLPGVVVLNRFDPADHLHRDNLDWLRARDGLDVETAGDAGLLRLAARLAGYGAGTQPPAVSSITCAPTLSSPEKS
jgi:dethiobiotin synthetase